MVELLYYQLAVGIIGLFGAVLSLMLLRPIRLWKWRKAGYRFSAAITLFSLIELMAITDIFWDPPIIQLITKGMLVAYLVYGVFEFRMLAEDELN